MSQAQECRGPHNRAKCPFYVVPENPLSAEISISKCVDCVTHTLSLWGPAPLNPLISETLRKVRKSCNPENLGSDNSFLQTYCVSIGNLLFPTPNSFCPPTHFQIYYCIYI